MPSVPAKVVLGWLILLLSARAGAEEPRAVLERAIRAHGGEARIARTKIGRIQAKVTGNFGPGGKLDATWEEIFDLPNRFRRTIEGQYGGKSIHWEFVVNGMVGWNREGEGAPQEFPVQEPVPPEGHWHTALLQLVALQDKEFRLTPLADQSKDGRTLVGIRVASPRGEAELYFDKSTNLLARARQPLPNVLPGRVMIGEISYEDYREVGGVRYPMHMRFSNGDTFTPDFQLTAVEFLDKIDDSAFAKPKVARPSQPASPPEKRAGQEGTSQAKDTGGAGAETPASWDIRLIAATLGAGAIVGAVWLFVRVYRRRKQEMPPT
jgi:hypothetical protein